MTRRYSILQTKLKELESILTDALLRGPETHSHEDIKQKLAFIGNLLSAEVAASSSSSSHHHHHLQHISQRLATLEKAFHEWDAFRVRALFSCGDDKDDDDGSDSTCSCNESCLNYDDENGELIVFDDPEKLFPDSVVGEKAIVEFKGSGVSDTIRRGNVGIGKLGSLVYEDAEDSFDEDLAASRGNKELVEFDGGLLGKKEVEEGTKENELGREERRESAFFGKNCCCAVAGGVVIGMSLMGFIMVNLSGCFYFVEQTSFAIPT